MHARFVEARRTILAKAHSQIGYVEGGGPGGHSGNITKYWAQTESRLQGASWCADFDSWVFEKAGYPLPHIDRSYGFINCADAVAWAKREGVWNASGHYSPCDLIFYCWNGSGVAEHTGIIVRDYGVAGIRTIEGNTSRTDAGSQSNGGGVYAKTRYHGSTVLGVIDFAKLAKWCEQNGVWHTAPAPKPHRKPRRSVWRWFSQHRHF